MKGDPCLRVQLLLALVSCLWLPGAGEGTEGGPSKGECRPPDRIAIRAVFLSVPQNSVKRVCCGRAACVKRVCCGLGVIQACVKRVCCGRAA